MAEAPRSLDVLLMIIGAVDGLPVRGEAIGDAWRLGAISGAEGKILERHARLSRRGRKMAALQPREVVDARTEALRAKLASAREELAASRDRREGRG